MVFVALRLCVSGLIQALQDVLRVCVCHEVSPPVMITTCSMDVEQCFGSPYGGRGSRDSSSCPDITPHSDPIGMAIPQLALVLPRMRRFDTSVSEIVDRCGHALRQRRVGERLTRQLDEGVRCGGMAPP